MNISAVFLVLALAVFVNRISVWIPWLGQKVGQAILAYFAGILAGTLFPELMRLKSVSEVGEIAVVLALPVFLFSTDWLVLRRMSGTMLKGFFLASVSVFLVVLAVQSAGFSHWSPAASAMMMGVYTGGTPNMAAIKVALNLPETLFISLTAFDTVFTALYLIPIMSFGRLFTGGIEAAAPFGTADLTAGWLKSVGLSCLVSAVLVAVSVGVGAFVPEYVRGAVVVSLVSVFGLAASAVKALRNYEVNEKTGVFLILIFCVAIGGQIDISEINADSFQLGGLVAVILFGSLALHYAFCKIFKISNAVFLITNVAAICSPPFIPPVAENAGIRSLIPAGISVGILGYAVGTFLGIGVYYLFS